MSSASANSSVKNSKEKNPNNIRVVGGPLSIEKGKNKEYSIYMNPEYVLDFSTPVSFDLIKAVGSYEKVTDKNGNIVKRVDKEAGIAYAKGKNGKIIAKRNKEQEK